VVSFPRIIIIIIIIVIIIIIIIRFTYSLISQGLNHILKTFFLTSIQGR